MPAQPIVNTSIGRNGAFDPETPDVDRIAGELDRLARKWAPRPRKPKAASPRS
jgi:hypothetical protein